METSPCIDAGDPTSPLDPDSTVCDMGACYHDQITILGDLNPMSPEITVFPNPVSDILNIHYYHIDNRNVTIKLFDISGKLNKRINVENQAGEQLYSIDLSMLDVGCYILTFNSPEYSSAKRIIKL